MHHFFWDALYYLPVNMPGHAPAHARAMIATILASHHDKFAIIDNGAGSLSTMLKVKQVTTTFGEDS